jgi:polysaccharide biosynthesis protein PslH
MKLMLLTQVLPYPPDSGPKVKTWNVLKYLAMHHEVTLVSFVRGNQEPSVEKLRQVCKAVYTVPIRRGILADGLAMVKSILTNQPWMMVRDERREMFKLVEYLSSDVEFDIVHADQLNMAQYAARVKSAAKVLDAHNALWLLYKRLYQTLKTGPYKLVLFRDWRLLKKYEGKICRTFDGILTVSEEDRRALLEAAGQPIEMKVIPIAVDTDEISPVKRHSSASHLLHIGTMFWLPNVDGIIWFVREILHLIRQQYPNTVFDVVGANPPKSVVELGVKDSGVNVTGYVTDPQTYLEQAGVMVVPLRAGGGMRVKILNAMAQELPIVSTTLGCEGIAVEHEKHLLIADTPQEFAEAVVRLLDHPELGRKLSSESRKLVQSIYDYRVACEPITNLYQSVRKAA